MSQFIPYNCKTWNDLYGEYILNLTQSMNTCLLQRITSSIKFCYKIPHYPILSLPRIMTEVLFTNCWLLVFFPHKDVI